MKNNNSKATNKNSSNKIGIGIVASGGVIHILTKIGIILGSLFVIILVLNFIPVAKTCDSNPILEKNDILIMAEKGGYIYQPGNTRKAFDNSVKDSYTDIVELDIRTAKDGILVVWEEETINSAAVVDKEAEPIYVNNTSVEELKKHNLGKNFIDSSNKKPYEHYTTQSSILSYGLSMMTFEEFVDRYLSYTSKYYIIDIQESGNAGCEAVDKIVDFLKEEEYEKFRAKVIFSANDQNVYKYINDTYDSYFTCGKGNTVKPLVNYSKFGFQFLYRPTYQLAQVNMRESGIFGINFNLVKGQFINKVSARNIALIYTNVNTKEDIAALYKVGAHVIGTGDQKLVNNTLKELDKEAKK